MQAFRHDKTGHVNSSTYGTEEFAGRDAARRSAPLGPDPPRDEFLPDKHRVPGEPQNFSGAAQLGTSATLARNQPAMPSAAPHCTGGSTKFATPSQLRPPFASKNHKCVTIAGAISALTTKNPVHQRLRRKCKAPEHRLASASAVPIDRSAAVRRAHRRDERRLWRCASCNPSRTGLRQHVRCAPIPSERSTAATTQRSVTAPGTSRWPPVTRRIRASRRPTRSRGPRDRQGSRVADYRSSRALLQSGKEFGGPRCQSSEAIFVRHGLHAVVHGCRRAGP